MFIFIMKIYLTTTNDMMSWEFIVKVLKEVDIHDKLITIIWEPITTVNMNVLWQGQKGR